MAILQTHFWEDGLVAQGRPGGGTCPIVTVEGEWTNNGNNNCPGTGQAGAYTLVDDPAPISGVGQTLRFYLNHTNMGKPSRSEYVGTPAGGWNKPNEVEYWCGISRYVPTGGWTEVTYPVSGNQDNIESIFNFHEPAPYPGGFPVSVSFSLRQLMEPGDTFASYRILLRSCSGGDPCQGQASYFSPKFGRLEFDKWIHFVANFRHSYNGNGMFIFYWAHEDDTSWNKTDYTGNLPNGNLGIDTPINHTNVKFGCYKWPWGQQNVRDAAVAAGDLERTSYYDNFWAGDDQETEAGFLSHFPINSQPSTSTKPLVNSGANYQNKLVR